MGRGTGSFDEEGRQFIVSSISIKIWHVKEYSYQLLPEEEYGHFFSSEGWYRAMKERELKYACIILIIHPHPHPLALAVINLLPVLFSFARSTIF